tara:strand:- start:746 stop:1615 length:870 start_codon:yes stop_codon:yes gene_type:complete
MASEIYLGCEQLGGTDWGDYDIDETIELSKAALKIGFHGFDIADCYSLGLAEMRLSEVVGNSNSRINFITKGGIRWESKNKRAITWKDSSPEYLESAVKNSIKRLNIGKIPIYLIHWYDPRVDIIESLKLLNSLKESGYIEKIGVANPSINWLSNSEILSLIDHIQVNDNIIKPFPFPKNFEENKIKFNISVSSYGILFHGMLTNKYNEDSSFPINDRRYRMPDFNNQNFISRRNDLYKTAVSQNKPIEEIAISHCVNKPIIDILIIGCKTRSQAISNVNFFKNAMIMK